MSEKKGIIKDPYYFGVYANMARHNVFLILNDIARKVKSGTQKNEEEIPEHDKEEFVGKNNVYVPPPVLKELHATNNKDRQVKIIELLHEHFPFLEMLGKQLKASNPDPKLYYDFFEKLFTTLHRIRNQYTHAFHKNTHIDSALHNWLDIIFDGAVLKAKERFGWAEVNLSHLRRYVYKDKQDKKPLTKHERRENKKGQIKERLPNAKFAYRFSTDDEQNEKEREKEIAFFLCLFLEKEYIFKFLKQLDGFDDIYSPEVYSVCRSRMPRHKLKSDNPTQAILLDMLNELQCCPAELYDTLKDSDDKEGKDRFLTRESDMPGEVPDSQLLRKKSRFPYFALRYLEYTGQFSNLDFCIDLGKYVYHVYEKRDSANEPYLRRWEKPIHVFCKLSELENNYPEILSAIRKDPSFIDDKTEPPYLIETNPHYHFEGGDEKNIGLKLRVDSPLLRPFRERTSHDGTFKIHVPINTQADFVLCTDELPGVLFYDFLCKEYNMPGFSAERLIIDHQSKSFSFLQDMRDGKVLPVAQDTIINQYQKHRITATSISKGKFKDRFKERKALLAEMLRPYGMEPHTIPEKLCRYLMGVEGMTLQDRADTILHKMLEETEDLIGATEAPAKTRQYKNVLRRTEHLRAGQRATYLADDMVFFQPHRSGHPEDGPNADQYKMLQAAIAFFSRDRQYMERLFRDCRLVSSDNPHPFLHHIKLQKCKANIDLYTAYLEQRAIYLQGCIDRNRTDGKYAATLHFLTLKEAPNDHELMMQYVGRMLRNPLNLPRGLFKDATIDIIKVSNDPIMQDVVSSAAKEPNIVYLLQKYFELKLQDNSQRFYKYPRNYRIVDELLDKRTLAQESDPIQKHYKTVDSLNELAKGINRTELKTGRFELLRKQQNTGKKKSEEPAQIHTHTIYKVYCDQVIENEKKIRHHAASDQVLFLMCKNMIGDATLDINLAEAFKGAKLEDIEPSIKELSIGDVPLSNVGENNNRANKNILNTTMTYKLPIRNKMGDVVKIIVAENVKVKDYGKFRRLLKDTRLASLLPYYPDKKEEGKEKEVSRDDLIKELDAFETQRLEVFKAIHGFERACAGHESFDDEINAKLQSAGYVDHNTLLNKFFTKEHIQDKDEVKNKLRVIRNAFSHNKYPQYDNSLIKGDRMTTKQHIDSIMNESTMASECYITTLSKYATQRYDNYAEKLIAQRTKTS